MYVWQRPRHKDNSVEGASGSRSRADRGSKFSFRFRQDSLVG